MGRPIQETKPCVLANDASIGSTSGRECNGRGSWGGKAFVARSAVAESIATGKPWGGLYANSEVFTPELGKIVRF